MRHELDDLAISLAVGRSRRDALRKVVLGAVGIPAVALGGIGLGEAEAKKHKSRNKNKRKKKKVTVCHNGQTITVSKKAKKKHLKHGDTVGPCPETPACTPEANPCGNRECGTVDNGCGVHVACGPNNGACRDTDTCNNSTGQCGCTPDRNPCSSRACGSVDNGCGTPVQCGANNGACLGTDTCNAAGECVCTPNPSACAGRECGTANDGCGQQVACGANVGACPGTDFCDASGQCLPAACQNCDGCCTDERTCVAGNDRQACGYGGRCEACNPEVACVNGECTCSSGVSCGQGCCSTDQNGRPFCDNTKRPCGDTCIPKEACCTGADSSSYQSLQPGCLPNETCAVNQSTGFGECRCGTGGAVSAEPGLLHGG